MKVTVTPKGDRLYYKLIDKDNKDLYEKTYISIYERKKNYIFLDYLNLSRLPAEENIDFNLDDEITLFFNDERVEYEVRIYEDHIRLIMTDKMNPNSKSSDNLYIAINSYTDIEAYLANLYEAIVAPRYSFVCEDINSSLIDSHEDHHEAPKESIYSSNNVNKDLDTFNSSYSSNENYVTSRNGVRGFNSDDVNKALKRKLGGYVGRLISTFAMFTFISIIIIMQGFMISNNLAFVVVYIFIIIMALSLIAQAIYEVAIRVYTMNMVKLDNNTIHVSGIPSKIRVSICSNNKRECFIDMIRLNINGEKAIILPNKDISVPTGNGKKMLIDRLMEMELDLDIYEKSRVVDISKGDILEIIERLDREI